MFALPPSRVLPFCGRFETPWAFPPASSHSAGRSSVTTAWNLAGSRRLEDSVPLACFEVRRISGESNVPNVFPSSTTNVQPEVSRRDLRRTTHRHKFVEDKGTHGTPSSGTSRFLPPYPDVVSLEACPRPHTPWRGVLSGRNGHRTDLVVALFILPGPVETVPVSRLRGSGVLVPVQLVAAFGRAEIQPFLPALRHLAGGSKRKTVS